jgi:5'-3' exonuclease
MSLASLSCLSSSCALAVLPSSCKKLLPVTYHGLMSNENSPLSDFYPSVTSFEVNISSRNV